MIESDAIAIIQNVGFPIAVSLYFIFKVERVVKNNTEVLTRFCEQIKTCEVKK